MIWMEGAIWFGQINFFHQYLETIAGVLEQMDEETWHDQQEDKDKDDGSDLVIQRLSS